MIKQTDTFYAHSENEKNEKHLLSTHLFQTSKLSESFACKEDYKEIFRITGLLHDLGKYQPEFQRYLENGGKRGSVPHASWGSGYARLCRLIEASITIDGHHKGIPDNSAWKSDTEPFYRRDVTGFENVVDSFLKDTGICEEEIKKPKSLQFVDSSQREVFIRYLFSSLTDSDWLSTEEHFQKNKSDLRIGMSLSIDSMINKLEVEFAKKPPEGEVNHLRNKARVNALEKAEMQCGFFSLALPTGMGKTLTSMAWALRHAKRNNLKRIIVHKYHRSNR
jgi:CRISPR-associated endonuclease/helicase Cas3